MSNLFSARTVPTPTVRRLAALATTFAMFVGTLVTALAMVVADPHGVAGAAGEGFVAVDPVRVLDTRDGTGGRTGALRGDETISLRIAGENGIPDDATAVVINITSTRATEESFVTIWPDGQDRPLAASLNLDPGVDTPNLVIVGLGGGSIQLYNSSGSTDLIGDVTGYFIGTSELIPTTPTRLLDTRDGTGGTNGPVDGDSTIQLQIGGAADIPASADAVVVNITSIRASEPAFVTVFPTGTERPTAATLNTDPDQNTPNLAIARLGTGGAVDIYVSNGTTQLTADVMGYFDGAESFVSAAPFRLLDTRTGIGANAEPVGPDTTIDLAVAGVESIPDNASAVVLNITSIRSTEPSFLTVWPAGQPRPLAASLNTEPGQNTPNLSILKLGDGGALSIYNAAGTTDLTADVAGWFVSAPPEPRVLDLTDRSQATLSGTGFVEDNGLTSGGSYTWNTTTRTLEVEAGASAFATGEDFDAVSRIRADFYPYTPDATFDIDLDWWGTMTSFVGASASAEMTVTVRLLPRTGPQANSVIWSHVFVDDGIGSGLKALEILKIEDREQRTFSMPTLDPDTLYRMEVEAKCRVRVVFSIGATACDVRGGDRDVRVRDWSLTFTE